MQAALQKASIIEKTLKAPICETIPSTALRLHPHATFFLDNDAAANIPFETQGTKMITRFYNGYLVKNHQLSSDDLWICDGKIISPQDHADQEIDVQGLIIAPGYIDLQINGGFGYDFSSEPEKADLVASLLPQYGVTSFLPTLVSSSPETYQQAIPLLQPRKNPLAAEILGIHLEGPFLCPEKHGAHRQDLLQSFQGSDPLQNVYGNLNGVKVVTLAPELPGASAAIFSLRNQQIVVSAGHSQASYPEMQQAIQEGVTMATHLFNTMPPLVHREPGLVNAVLLNPLVSYSIIADKVHVHPSMIHLAWKTNPDGLILVTDAMEALGLSPGHYRLGEQEVTVDEKTAYVAGTTTIAGSILSMDKAVRHLRESTNCSIVEAIEAASWKPAKVLGIEATKGTLKIGADADFILLDDHLFVQACYIAGESVPSARQSRNSQ